MLQNFVIIDPDDSINTDASFNTVVGSDGGSEPEDLDNMTNTEEGGSGGPTTPTVTPYDQANGTDDSAALSKKIKVPFTRHDVKFWFAQLESQLRWSGVKAQFSKLQVLAQNLPPDIMDEVKPHFRVAEEEASNQCYKRAKDNILELFAKSEEEEFAQALGLTLVGKPSTLCKKIMDLICNDGINPLANCHCGKTVAGIWKSKLPPHVLSAIAGKKLTSDNMKAVMKLADDVYAAQKPASKNQVSAVATSLGQADLEDEDDYDPEVAAIQPRGRGRGARRGGRRGRGTGQQRSQPQQAQQGSKPTGGTNKPEKRHSDNPPEDSCPMHWQYGKSTYYCTFPLTCPWKKFINPRPKNDQ